MDLKVQPKPEVKIKIADKGIISWEEYFVEKQFEKINQYFFPGHLIRKWRPKAELIYPPVPDENVIQYECDFNRDVQSCFVEDFAEEVFLRSPPPCFVVFGKYNLEVVKLGQEIAEEFSSILINVDNIVNQVINSDTESARFLDKVLRVGVSITLNFVLALLSYIAHTPEARHRGYVLCGLPCFSYLHDLSAEQQFDYLFSWDNKPTFFINVEFDDEDLVLSRTNTRCELKRFGKKTSILAHVCYNLPEKEEKEKDDEEEGDGEKNQNEEDEDEDIEEFEDDSENGTDLDFLPSRPWVQLPRDEESEVWTELEFYETKIKPVLDLIRSRVDPQFYISVDSRINNSFEVIRARLSLLQIWKAPIPFPFFRTKEPKSNFGVSEEPGEEDYAELEGELQEDDELMILIDEPPQRAFLALFTKKTLSPKFRWELSHYNYMCPVSLRDGVVKEGKTKYAVVFLKYIYFLYDNECMQKFLKNPRPYVLPVRPRPSCRFIILGYPYSGKTTLAEELSEEFSIPIIDVTKTLKNDLILKKKIYLEFCQKKAEARQIIKLTALAWQKWRAEEDQRINLIEKWIGYIQCLLRQRINDFYSTTMNDNTSEKETQLQSHSPLGSSEFDGEEMDRTENEETGNEEFVNDEELNDAGQLEIRGTRIAAEAQRNTDLAQDDPSPSFKLVQALKHEDFDFNEKCLEVEANLFFSSLWNSFSNPKQTNIPTSFFKKDLDEEVGEEEIEGEGRQLIRKISDNSDETDKKEIPVNWCSMLPPQSLSSFLLKKTPYTTRERRQSFQILLTAASKKYWDSSTLKTEFVKWRLPCFMDIPLCEVFLDNPFLLYKYCPDWLKERPYIPDPISSNHESVIEAGRRAYVRASIVTVSHDRQEVWKLIQDAIEKAERDGMRVSGEIITPGGWVIDNMVLDLDVWCGLAKANIEVDYVYILNDSDPDHRRIINTWYDSIQKSDLDFESESEIVSNAQSLSLTLSNKIFTSQSNKEVSEDDIEVKSALSTEDEYSPSKNFFLTLLKERTELERQGEKQLDTIFSIIIENLSEVEGRLPVNLMDVFTHGLLRENLRNWNALKGDLSNEEIAPKTKFLSESLHNIHTSPSGNLLRANMNLGNQLEKFSDKIIQLLIQQIELEPKPEKLSLTFEDKIKFFESLLLLPTKLNIVKKFLESTNRAEKIKEIDIAGKTPEQIFVEVKTSLLRNFIKKPRELEYFEVDEVMRELEEKKKQETESDDSESGEDGTEKDDEDLDEEEDYEDEENENKQNALVIEVESGEIVGRTHENIIYGESGPFCVVNLERNILLQGQPEHILRYYGKLYFFWNEEAKKKFIEDPEKYAPYYSAIRCLPPLRVFVVGPVGSGKTTLARTVAEQCSLHHVDYFSLLNYNLVPHLESEVKKITALDQQNQLLLSSGYNEEAKMIKDIYSKAPYDKKKYWLNDPFDVKEEETEVQTWGSWIANNRNMSYPQLSYDYIDALDQTGVITESSKTPFISMKQAATYLSNYIHKQTELPESCVMKTLGELWREDPFVNNGFVLEGFPFRELDIRHMMENNWLPDIIVEVQLPENLVIERNIDKAMVLWEEKLNQEKSDESELEDTLNNIRATLETHRRLNLISKKRLEAWKKLKSRADSIAQSELTADEEEEGGESHTKSSLLLTNYVMSTSVMDDEKIVLPQEVDAKIREEVNELMAQEFKPMTFDPVFETFEAGKKRIQADYEKNYRVDMVELSKIKTTLKNMNIPWYEVDGTADPKKTQIDLFRELNKYKKRFDHKSEFAFTMTMKMAEQLLDQGFYFLSKFGKWCPVQVYRMKNPINMFIPLRKRHKITPIAYRNYIYFVGGKQEKLNFLNDPLKYTFNESHNINIPLRIAIIGPPKSGKTTLSDRLGMMFSLKVVTMGRAIRFVLENMQNTSLRKSIDDYLKRGCFLPLSLKIEALIACLNDPVCVTQGFVLDGIPFDAAVTQSLAEKGLLPFVIISLVCEPHFGKVNREELDLKLFRLPYKQRVNLDSRYKDWKDTYQRFFQWNKDTYNNLYEVNAKLNVVDIFYEAYDIIRKSFFGILYYVEYCVTDRALPLQYLCVSQHEYELRKSEYQSICPVCWTEKKLLSCSTDPPVRSNLVQYLNHFYYVCSNHMKKFLQHPKIYFPPLAPECPKILPKILSKGMFEAASFSMKVHGNGRCPVTRIDFPDSLDWEGSWYHAAAYGERIYLCKNEERLLRFVAQPWKYCFADTEFEMNRHEKSQAVKELEPPVLSSLPPMGFLEQTVAKLIQDALHIVGGIRPVYPNVSPTGTACTFIGLYLKVFNKKHSYTSLEVQYLQFLTYNCVAYRYRVKNIRKTFDIQEDETNETTRDTETSDESEDNDNQSVKVAKPEGKSDVQMKDFERIWLDLEYPGEKKLWSAKYQGLKELFYKLENNELHEIPDPPKNVVILTFHPQNIRSSPLPPVENLITYIYSCKPPLQIPEPFNVNTLFQPQPLFPTPFPSTLPFVIEKQISAHLYYFEKPRYLSHPNIYEGKRNLSENTLDDTKPKKVDETDLDLHFMNERFVPRFQLLDKIIPNAVPDHPKVVEIPPIFYNPHKEYSYTLLMSHFFKTSHLLKCLEWRECTEVLEFCSLFDKNIWAPGSDVLFKPKLTSSMISLVSKTSNQLHLETFKFYNEPERKKQKPISFPEGTEVHPSVSDFMNLLILESLNNIFVKVSEHSLSYESFETHASRAGSDAGWKPQVLFREIIPYPPLLWDMSSRPYYAYRATTTVFHIPKTENVVHGRHFSALDGIKDTNNEFRFMRIPSWVDSIKKFKDENLEEWNRLRKKHKLRRTFFVYDVFNFQWTSFLVCPFSWAYDRDIKDNFKNDEGNRKESSVEEVLTMSVMS